MFGDYDLDLDTTQILNIRQQTPPPPDLGFFLLMSGGGMELTDGYLLKLSGVSGHE